MIGDITIPLHTGGHGASNQLLGSDDWIVLISLIGGLLFWLIHRHDLLDRINQQIASQFLVPILAVVLITAPVTGTATVVNTAISHQPTESALSINGDGFEQNQADTSVNSGTPQHSHDHNDNRGGAHYAGAANRPKPGSAAAIKQIHNTIKAKGVDAMKKQFGGEQDTGGHGHSGHGHNHGKNAHSVAQFKLDRPQKRSVCPRDAPVEHFTIHAIQVDIVYNAYGQHDPNGVMYVLASKKDDVLRQVRNAPNASIENPNPNATSPLVQPLVIRANLGDCVKVTFNNDLSVPASMHMIGLPYNVSSSDGMAVGYNKPSFAGPDGQNDTVTYTYYASNKGTHFFADGTHLADASDPEPNSDPVSNPDMAGNLRSNGLFGALIVEPKNATWTDPQTGKPLRSGIQADIHLPNKPDYREIAVFYHDNANIVNADGSQPTWPHSNETSSLYTINYRGDPMGARLRERNESTCPACDKPEMFYSSWVHGDPGGGDLVYEAYAGDPVKFRLIGAQAEENHVHHLHGHRWLSTPGDPKSNTIDSQTVSPGATYTATLIAGAGEGTVRPNMTYSEAVAAGGAGYIQTSPGDYIFHCHLFPHYASGMWAILRVFEKDTRGDDGRTDLQPLPDRDYQPNDTTVPPAAGQSPTNNNVADRSLQNSSDTGDTISSKNATSGNTASSHNGTDQNTGHAPRNQQNKTGTQESNTSQNQDAAPDTDATASDTPNRVGPNGSRIPERVGALWVPEGKAKGRAERILRHLDTDSPPDPTKSDPGFPKFIPAKRGHRPPRPPGLPGGREPTPLEESAINGSGISDPIVPGAPYVNPCPKSADIRRYNITVFETEVNYNDKGYDDTAKMYALSKHVDEIRSGEMRPRPLVIRSHVGECVVINLTNQLPPDEEPNEVSMHVHFVGFDILGSDGLVLGYNYDSGAEPVGDTDESRVVNPRGEGSYRVDTTGNITYRWYADEQGTIFWHDHLQGIEKGMHGLFGTMIVEPKNSTWKDPYTNQTIEVGPRARIIQPNGTDFREQVLAYQDFARLHANVTTVPGSRQTVQINPPHTRTLDDQGVSAINYANAPLYWRNNRRHPTDPAYAFSSWMHGDPSTPIVEAYRGDPIRIRLFQGTFEEQHNFMLQGHRWRQEYNDPDSPQVASQTLGVSEQFEFHVRAGGIPENGSQLEEPMDGLGGYVAGLGSTGVPAAAPGSRTPLPVRDYLYGSMATTDLWNGMWGIFRVWQTPTKHLKPLPDFGYPERNPPTSLDANGNDRIDMKEFPGYVKTRSLADVRATAPNASTMRSPVTVTAIGKKPPQSESAGHPCPPGAETIHYNVTILRTNIRYNQYGNRDPNGIVYVLSRHVDEIRSGERRVKPLVLRAHEGDCIEITLTNGLGPVVTNTSDTIAESTYPHLPNDLALRGPEAYEHPRMNVIVSWPPSARASLFMTNLHEDVRGSGGITVGLNPDQTIAPGEKRTYRFYADQQGTTVFWDGADIRGHRHHGAYGMLIVEPPNSTWLDPETGEEIRTGTRAIIKRPNKPDFREFALLLADGTHLKNPDDTRPIPGWMPDPEDQGFPAINYRTEPFARRLGSVFPFSPRPPNATDPRESMVLSSRVHGDPSTPVFRAYVGDPVVFRVAQAADQRRGVSLHITGHQFRYYWRDPESPIKGVRGEIMPGKAVDIRPVHGAGGFQEAPGDYLIRPMKVDNMEGGMWAIFRVRGKCGEIKQLPDRDRCDAATDTNRRDQL